MAALNTIRAHYDGHVFVPDEPVDVPPGTQVNIPIESIEAPEPGSWAAIKESFGRISPPAGFDASRVTREDLYD